MKKAKNLTGTIDEIGHDVKRIKEIGISHIIFGFKFSPVSADIDRIIEITSSSSHQSISSRDNPKRTRHAKKCESNFTAFSI